MRNNNYCAEILTNLAGNKYTCKAHPDRRIRIMKSGNVIYGGNEMTLQEAFRAIEAKEDLAPKSLRAKHFIGQDGFTLKEDVDYIVSNNVVETPQVDPEEEAGKEFENMSPYRALVETDKRLLKEVMDKGISPFPGSKKAFEAIYKILELL